MSHPKPTIIEGKLYKSRCHAARELGISDRKVRYAIFKNNGRLPCIASTAKFKKICVCCDNEKYMTNVQLTCADCKKRWGHDLSRSTSVRQKKYLDGRGHHLPASNLDKARYKQKRWEQGLDLICENSDGHHGFDCYHAGKKFKMKEQLDINHKDGNRYNNDPANLESICKCCHAVVTKNENHSKPNKYKKYKGETNATK